MSWLKNDRLPAWLLCAAAAGSAVVADEAPAQYKPANTGNRPPAAKKPASAAQPVTAPQSSEVQQVQAQSTSGVTQTAQTANGETAVQAELRRLYQESGREMPTVPTSMQPQQNQRPQTNTGNIPKVQQVAPQQTAAQPAGAQPSVAPATGPMPQMVPAQAAAPQQIVAQPISSNPSQAGAGGVAPASSAPTSKSKNPVTAFFRRITGQSSKPTATAPAPASSRPNTPPPAPPAMASGAPGPNRQNYAPYSGQQPRKLNQPELAQTPAAPAKVIAPQTTATNVPNPLPPSPVDYSPKVAKVAPPATLKAHPLEETAKIPTPQVTPAPAQAPAELPVLAQKPLLEEPEFLPPTVIENVVTAQAEPVPAVAAMPVAPVTQAAPAAVAATDFPDPFPELSEEEADEDLEEAMESQNVALDDEDPFAMEEKSAEGMTEVVQGAAPVVPNDAALSENEDFLPPVVTEAPVTADVPKAAGDAPELPLLPPTTTVAVATPPAMPELPRLDAVPSADPPRELAATDSSSEPQASLQTAAPSATTPADPSPAPAAETNDANMQKMALIRGRATMKGLKGFCPVSLRDERELKDSQSQFVSSFRGQKFHFASSEAKAKFDQEPARYAPAAYGADVVILTRDKDVAEGSLDFAAWYKGRLYLFGNQESHDTFVSDPAKYATPAGIE